MAEFLDGLLTSTLKVNNCLGRALITGTARVATAPVLPGVNDLYVASPTTPRYETSFGLTEAEVAAALAEHDMGDRLDETRDCCGGFTCGDKTAQSLFLWVTPMRPPSPCQASSAGWRRRS